MAEREENLFSGSENRNTTVSSNQIISLTPSRSSNAGLERDRERDRESESQIESDNQICVYPSVKVEANRVIYYDLFMIYI